MKTTFLLMATLLVTHLASAQQLVVKTPAADTMTLRYSLPFSISPTEEQLQNLVPQQGKSVAALNIAAPRFGYLAYGDKTFPVYFEPGKSTVVSFLQSRERPQFEGELANENTLLNSPAFQTYGHTLFDSLRKEPALSPAALKLVLFNLRSEKLYAFARYTKSMKLSGDFMYLFSEELMYYYENVFGDFFNHWQMSEQAGDTALRSQWYNTLGDVYTSTSVINEKALAAPAYKVFLDGYFRYAYQTKGRNVPYVEKLMGKSRAEIMAWVKDIGSELPVTLALSNDWYKDKVGAYFGAVAVIAYTRPGGVNLNTALHAQALYDSLYPGSPFRPQVVKALQPLKDYMATPGKAAQISYYDNASYPTLEKVLAQFKGKVIYLDTWATWCGYCQQQFTWLPELKQRFGKDLVYLYISIDEDSKASEWKHMAGFFKLEGNHYRVGNSGENYRRLLAIFGKKETDRFGIPAYAIINRQGEVVANNAFRPGDKEQLYQQLQQYLAP
jgi:thiol-disulfide isomerase/thioredoxin